MSDDFSSSNEAPKSKYNAALSQLYRLDSLWQKAHAQREARNLIQWNITLDSIWSELSEDATTAQIKVINKIQRDLVMSKFFTVTSSESGFKKPDPNKIKLAGELYQKLMIKEMILRRLQNKQGKGAAYEESIDDYMDD